jgi:hypothetical protein
MDPERDELETITLHDRRTVPQVDEGMGRRGLSCPIAAPRAERASSGNCLIFRSNPALG